MKHRKRIRGIAKWSIIHVITVSGERSKNREEKKHKEIIAWNFTKLNNEIRQRFKSPQEHSNRIKKTTHRHSIVEFESIR